jgi:uncharacterized delta-60 repeat protein
MEASSANSNKAAHHTTRLIISGDGFREAGDAEWSLMGAPNSHGVTADSITFNSPRQLPELLAVAADGRNAKQKGSCSALVPLNPTLPTFACSSATGQTCLDATFGNLDPAPGGLVLTNTDGAISSTQDLDEAQAVEVQPQPDGTSRLVAIGITSSQNVRGQSGVALVRYNTDGTLDTAFGTGGIAKFFSTSSNLMLVHGGAIDNSGNILAVADQNGATGLVRFTPAGILDTTFNSTGYLTVSNLKPSAMQIQSDGKILVGGTQVSAKTIVGVIFRFNTNGTLDSTFGSKGQASINSLYLLNALTLQSVNSQQYILAGGEGSASNNLSVVRLTSSGLLDSTFGGSGGIAATNFCGLPSVVFSLSVDSIGNILAGGTAQIVSAGPPQFGIARFTSNGALDTTFGDPSTSSSGRTGQTMLDFLGSENHLTSIQPVLDSGGSQIGFMVGGYAYKSTGSNGFNKYLALAKYHADGSTDTTFGTNGGFIIDFGSANNFMLPPANNNLLIQSDGRVVIGGTSGFTSGSFAGYNFALARLWP